MSFPCTFRAKFADINFYFLSSKYVTLHAEINYLSFCWKILVKIIIIRRKNGQTGTLGMFLKTTNNIK